MWYFLVDITIQDKTIDILALSHRVILYALSYILCLWDHYSLQRALAEATNLVPLLSVSFL